MGFMRKRFHISIADWTCCTNVRRVRIVKNELRGSATQQELRGWGFGGSHNGMNSGTGVKPPNPRQFEPWMFARKLLKFYSTIYTDVECMCANLLFKSVAKWDVWFVMPLESCQFIKRVYQVHRGRWTPVRIQKHGNDLTIKHVCTTDSTMQGSIKQ